MICVICHCKCYALSLSLSLNTHARTRLKPNMITLDGGLVSGMYKLPSINGHLSKCYDKCAGQIQLLSPQFQQMLPTVQGWRIHDNPDNLDSPDSPDNPTDNEGNHQVWVNYIIFI